MDQKNLIKLLGFWISNTIVLSIFSALYVGGVVLGNASISKPVATIINALILAIVVYLVPSIVKKLDLKIKISAEKVQAADYFLVNFVVLWILKRLADITGLGISSILNVLIVAIVLALIQVGVQKYLSKTIKKS
ncbi:MAG: hypothetical protein UR98_C0001G0032 [Parcubacteria group bacterium GW2011_GWA1_36_12]|nr:MAG: hypothetical protein UR98_C0001G0032 [Parcubacteria group bacterium GW2011_GWA1_36_12]